MRSQKSTISIGSRFEKQVEELYQSNGYRTHRNIKSRFGTQDVLGVADVVCTKSDDFVLVACAVGRYQTETVRKIEALRPFLPKEIRIQYRVLNKDGTESLREY